jgi:hypothetical protein
MPSVSFRDAGEAHGLEIIGAFRDVGLRVELKRYDKVNGTAEVAPTLTSWPLVPAGTSMTRCIQRGNVVRRQAEVRSLGETFYLRDAGGASNRRRDTLARH